MTFVVPSINEQNSIVIRAKYWTVEKAIIAKRNSIVLFAARTKHRL